MKQTMKQFELHPMRLLAGACGLFTLLALAPASVAQQAALAATKTVASPTTQSAVAAKPALKPVAEEESAVPNSANQQGIKVHGHWVLQVKNADGTLGERREFDNSLVTDDQSPSGDQLLAGLLSGNLTPGDPTVVLIQFPSGASGPIIFSQVCQDFLAINGSPNACYPFTTSSKTIVAQNFNTSFSIPSETGLMATTSWSSPVKWVLSGIYTVPSGLTSITHVETLLDVCFPIAAPYTAVQSGNFIFSGISGDRHADISSGTCTSTNTNNQESLSWGTLTGTAITPSALAVTPGQIVQVTVTISFS
jgi:hypothetical protein